jgi:hypothetical protein
MKIKLITLFGKHVDTIDDVHKIDGVINHKGTRYRYDTWIGHDTIQYRETNDYWEKKITGK